MADKIGKKFEDFIILKVLNRGNYGYVAKVKSKLDNNIYAMKRIDLNLIKLNTLPKYYKNEYNIISSLKHENVYRALSKFEEKDVLYIITEYMDGGNLLDLFNWYKEKEINIDEKKLLNIFVQCLKGLKYIHEKGIIHRSIKHDNIIFDSNDKIKIINFKYSIKKTENDNQIIDIDRLTAPEMKKKEGYDEKADVYSMGMIFSSLAYLSSKTNPTKKGNYSRRLYSNIEKMKNERPSSSEIYLDFINMYYEAIRACLKCLICCFNGDFKEPKNDELIKLEGKGFKEISITKKMIELSKIGNLKSEEAISWIEKFSKNVFDMSKINVKEFTELILTSMHEENKLNKNTNEIDINPKDNNETKKKKLKEYYTQYIENNKTLILENFLITYIKTKRCPNCEDDKNLFYLFENSFYININKENLDSAKTKFNEEVKKNEKNKENGIIKYVFDVLNDLKKDIKSKEPEICESCGENPLKYITTKFYELQKYLIFVCEPEIEFKDEDKENLSKFKIGKKEVDNFENDCTYEYKLISVIIKSKDGYDYYNLSKKLFKKNDGEVKPKGENLYSLKEMSGNLVALYYYSDLKKKENTNIDTTFTTDNTSNNNNYPYQKQSESCTYTVTNQITITNNNGRGNQIEIKNEISKGYNNNNNLSNNNINNYINNNSQNRQNPNNARDKILNNLNENSNKKNEDEQNRGNSGYN